MPSTNNIATESLAGRVAKHYGIQVAAVLPMQKGYRNQSYPVRLQNGQLVNVLIYKNEPDIIDTIKNANSVSNFLAEHDFPARQTINSKIIRLQSGVQSKFASLYNYLPGQTIAWEAYTQKHIKLLGKTMSDMHVALNKFDDRNLPDVTEIYLQIVSRMRRYFALPGVQHALQAKLELSADELIFDKFEIILQACKALEQQQALHMDFVRSNILFSESLDGPVISGILDFEKTARGNPVFDLARTLAFLLVDCKYKQADKVRKYFLYSGYEKRGKSNLLKIKLKTIHGEAELLEILVDLFLAYDFYKFLKHNPYEFLHENEHFTRTQDLLLRRGCIAKIAAG